jgi:hypothetical protein
VGGQPGGRGFGIDLTTLVGVLIAHLVGWQYISFHERCMPALTSGSTLLSTVAAHLARRKA